MLFTIKNVNIAKNLFYWRNKTYTISGESRDKESIILSFQKTTFYNGECYYSRQFEKTTKDKIKNW